MSSGDAADAQAQLTQAQTNVAMQPGPGLPNTLFDGYSQDELYNMFQEEASPGAVQNQSDDFKTVSAALSDIGDQIVTAMQTAQQNWTGTAADSAMESAKGIVAWHGTLAGGSNAASLQVQTQSDALSTARAEVPQPVQEPSFWGAVGQAFTQGPKAAYDNYENQKQAASDAKAAQVQVAQQYDSTLDATSPMPQFDQNATSTGDGSGSSGGGSTGGGGSAGGVGGVGSGGGGYSGGGSAGGSAGGSYSVGSGAGGGGYAVPAGAGAAGSGASSSVGSGPVSGVSTGGTSTAGSGGSGGAGGGYGVGEPGGWSSGSQNSQDAAAAAGMMPPMAVGGGGFAGGEDTYSAGRGYGGSASGSYGGSAGGSAGSVGSAAGSGSGAGARSGATPGAAAAERSAMQMGAAEAKAGSGAGMAGGPMGARGNDDEDEEHFTKFMEKNDNDGFFSVDTPTVPPVIG